MVMDKQDRQRFVQQYVERQKAYIPTYTTGQVASERRTPSKLPRSDREFGFDTPVLRPRAPVKPQAIAPSGPADEGSPSKSKPRNKRKKASTPIDTDNGRAARLADRRERKRKKRAIVNPPEDEEENARTTAVKKGKTKRPAALALMYGFSATNVTKNRLTLKSAPSLGVFSKGKASTKKKVTTRNESLSKNELFSESAFLNKSSERTDDLSKIDDDSDHTSMCHYSASQETRVTNRTNKDRGQGPESSALKRPSWPTHTTAGSEIWDIEMYSRLPSSACDVLSEPGTKASAPAVLDLRGAEWSASIHVAEEHDKHRSEAQVLSFPPSQSWPRIGSTVIGSSPPAGLGLGDGLHTLDISSLHPSHSASQAGHRAVDAWPSDLRPVTSKYFIDPKPDFDQDFTASPEPVSGSIDGFDVLDTEDRDSRDAEPIVQTIHRRTLSTSSLISVPLDVDTFQNQHEVVPQVFATNECPCEDCWIGANVPSELMGGSGLSYLESAETQRDRFVTDAVVNHEGGWHSLAGEYEGGWNPSVPEHEDDGDKAELAPELWEPCMVETDVDDSICWNEDEGADFLEGRALLRGVEGAGWTGPSGLDQVERDVASRLRFHWRPLRL